MRPLQLNLQGLLPFLFSIILFIGSYRSLHAQCIGSPIHNNIYFDSFNDGFYMFHLDDIDQDGHLDIVVPVQTQFVLKGYLLYGSANGTMVETYGFETEPDGFGDVTSGDFNGDGRIDIASTCGDSLCVFLAGPGATRSNFLPVLKFYTGGGTGIINADFDGNGSLDIAITNTSTNTVSILLGNGSGGFGSVSSYPVGFFARQLITDDFNGDGVLDIATANESSSNISLLFGNGNGTFGATVTLPLATSTNLTDIDKADFNGDGFIDLATSDYFYGSNIFINNGNGTFAAPYIVPVNGYSLATGDYNGDGLADIAIGTPTGPNIAAGYGDGTFSTPTTYYYTDGIDYTESGDFNNDGLDDIAVSSYTPGNFNFSPDKVSVFRTSTRRNVTLSPTVCGSYTSPSGNYTWTTSGTYMDTIPNATGCDSVITINLTVSYSSVNSIDFEPAVNYPVFEAAFGVTAADFDDDGDMDMAAANFNPDKLSVFMGNGDGTFGAATHYSVPSRAASVKHADFNNDGIPDLASTNFFSANVSVLLGNGDGTFGAATNFPAGAKPRYVASSDFNGDGNADMAVTNLDSDNVSILLGNGNGTFAATTNYTVGDYPASLSIADFNGDTFEDLVVPNRSSGTISILLGNGNGTFAAAANYPAGTFPATTAVGDFNGNGFIDLALVNNQTNYVSILLGNGDGTFNSAASYTTDINAVWPTTLDFNNDGILDLAVANITANNVSVLQGNGNGTFGAAVNYTVGDAPRHVISADFNGDGVADLAVANDSSSNVSVLLGIGSNIYPVVCDSYLSPAGNTYTTSGTYTEVIPNTAGCDSTITINLTVNNSTSATINAVVCDSYTSPAGNTYTTSGTYTDVIPNATGCDSVITILLTVNNSSTTAIYPVACGSYTSPSGNYTWTASGIYMDTIPNTAGCDSVIKVNLTVNTVSTYYADMDGDGYGDPNVTIQACSPPAGYVSNNNDCDDSDNAVNPGAPEVCDGADNNCDGNADEGLATTNYFPANPLTHSGSGSGSTTAVLSPVGNAPSFTVSNMDALTNGKPSDRYIEAVTITYINGNGLLQSYGTFYGDIQSSVNVNIPGSVLSITVYLTDGYDGNSNTGMAVNLSTITYCGGPACPDADNDGVCDVDDVCPGGDDNLIGTSCNDGDACSTGDVYTVSCNCVGTPSGDSDGDGVCNALDICPGGDDNIDTDNDGIPDFCDSGNCVEVLSDFNPNPLTHTSSGTSSSTVLLGGNTDVNFTISGIDAKTNGKPSRQYIEEVTVSYVNSASQFITYGVYRGDQVSSATISIQDVVESVNISITDVNNGTTESTMSIDISQVSSCPIGSSKLQGQGHTSMLKAYPNPFSSTTNIEFTIPTSGRVSLDIYDMKGAMMKSLYQGEVDAGKTQQVSLNGSLLMQHLYIVRLTTANEVKYLKLFLVK